MMTRAGTEWRLTAPRAVILAEASRTAFGGTTGFGGNPEEQRQPPVGIYTSTGVGASISGRVLVAMITDWIPAFFDPDGVALKS